MVRILRPSCASFDHLQNVAKLAKRKKKKINAIKKELFFLRLHVVAHFDRNLCAYTDTQRQEDLVTLDWTPPCSLAAQSLNSQVALLLDSTGADQQRRHDHKNADPAKTDKDVQVVESVTRSHMRKVRHAWVIEASTLTI